MAAPHNVERYRETWDQEEIAVVQAEIEAVRDFTVVSGGWAWHFMTPPHPEYKHAHDHKDADLFCEPDRLWELFAVLKERGYEKAWTRFDGVTPNFVRYVRTVERSGRPIKVIFDLFTERVPFVEVAVMDAAVRSAEDTNSSVAAPEETVRVVEPAYLLSLYGVKHSSDLCFSVQIARQLVAKGETPVGHPAMADYSKFISR